MIKMTAIQSIRPGASFIIRGDTVEWLDTVQTEPTEAEIQAEIIRLQADYKAKQYQRDRAKEYPSIVNQLDTLYHGGYDAWKATIQAVKDKYPKEQS
jgi:hypothetical protein